MNRLRFFVLSLAVGILFAAGVTYATVTWHGTAWITDGAVISATNIRDNFDYLYAAWTLPDANTVQTTRSVYAPGYFHTSDARQKTNIETASGLSIIQQLRGVTFNWQSNNAPSAGVVAQEVERVMPSAVHTDPRTGLKSVEYDQLIAPLIQAIKEQQDQIDQLRHDIEILKANR